MSRGVTTAFFLSSGFTTGFEFRVHDGKLHSQVTREPVRVRAHDPGVRGYGTLAVVASSPCESPSTSPTPPAASQRRWSMATAAGRVGIPQNTSPFTLYPTPHTPHPETESDSLKPDTRHSKPETLALVASSPGESPSTSPTPPVTQQAVHGDCWRRPLTPYAKPLHPTPDSPWCRLPLASRPGLILRPPPRPREGGRSRQRQRARTPLPRSGVDLGGG